MGLEYWGFLTGLGHELPVGGGGGQLGFLWLDGPSSCVVGEIGLHVAEDLIAVVLGHRDGGVPQRVVVVVPGSAAIVVVGLQVLWVVRF